MWSEKSLNSFFWISGQWHLFEIETHSGDLALIFRNHQCKFSIQGIHHFIFLTRGQKSIWNCWHVKDYFISRSLHLNDFFIPNCKKKPFEYNFSDSVRFQVFFSYFFSLYNFLNDVKHRSTFLKPEKDLVFRNRKTFFVLVMYLLSWNIRLKSKNIFSEWMIRIIKGYDNLLRRWYILTGNSKITKQTYFWKIEYYFRLVFFSK